MSCIYKYKGKDYTKDEFYSLVRTTMVQPRTVQKYEKVLFPTPKTFSPNYLFTKDWNIEVPEVFLERVDSNSDFNLPCIQK